MKNYVFDIDGTLTPSRLPIEKKFETFFLDWMNGKNVYLVTGSDKEKTVEQVGEKIWSSVKRVYQSCGNQVFENGKLIKQIEFHLDEKMEFLLNNFLASSNWTEKFGNHFEQRVGLVNFSIIGRNCTQDKREQYYQWDLINQERIRICKTLMHKFPNIEASVGGEISIDIHEKGKNKAQILDEIEGEIYFFGDKMDKGGNDYPIAHRLELEKREHKLFKVNSPTETWNLLKELN
tara:strand:+ start:154 stop:855 length:702 start_codon:yes stop_codon:yes gene_type:complete